MVAVFNGADLAAIAAVIAIVWFLLRWARRLDDYEDRIDREAEQPGRVYDQEQDDVAALTAALARLDAEDTA